MHLLCPTCRAALRPGTASYQCPDCDRPYPVVDGIVDLWPAGSDYYWSEVPPSVMQRAIACLRRQGYRAAAELVTSHNPELRGYLSDEKRIDWLFHCLESIETETCLDLGSGWGSLSYPLSRIFCEVWSLEGVWDRLRFQQAACEQLGLRNLQLVRGSLLPLPFPDRSFDLVVANGVLEWIGLVDLKRPVPELQAAFLREIRRVLKPNGVLYIGIENRFAFVNLRGARDHSGLPYTSLLPRRVASLAVRWFRRPDPENFTPYRTPIPWSDYRTYTYSLGGYRRLLTRAGFPNQSFAWVWPTYNLPWLSGDVESAHALSVFLEFMRTRAPVYFPPGSRRERLLRWGAAFPFRSWVNTALRWFTPGFLIFARTQAGAPLTLPSLQISGVHKIVAVTPSRKSALAVVKQPRFPEDVEEFEREQNLFRRFNASLTAERIERRQLPAYREPYLDGIAPDATSRTHQRTALRWLTNFHRQTQDGVWEWREWERQVERNWEEASPRMHKLSGLGDVLAGCRKFLQQYQASSVVRVAEHGDYWQGNLILQPPDRLYVLDWQHFRSRGDAFFDFFFLLFTNFVFLGPQRNETRAYTRLLPLLVAEFSDSLHLSTSALLRYLPYFAVRYVLRGTPSAEQLPFFSHILRSQMQGQI